MRIFVSRHLEDDSPLLLFCQINGFEILHESLLKFSPIPFDKIPKGDWLFFYSKSGIKYFTQQLTDEHTIEGYKIACYGPSTSALWKSTMGTIPAFTGDGKPLNVPADFMKILQLTDSVVFIRALHSKMAVQRAIEKDISCTDIIAYQNTQRHDVDLDGLFDIALLTSPMNADAFFESKPGYTGQIITLGTTTSDHISLTHQKESLPADIITEQGLLDKLKNIL